MQTQKAYKICRVGRRKPNQLTSAATCENSVVYRWNKWNRPNPCQNPFLFVFETKAHAQKFMGSSPIMRIYEVSARKVRTFAKGIHGVGYCAGQFPRGTLFCSSLRFVKRVK